MSRLDEELAQAVRDAEAAAASPDAPREAPARDVPKRPRRAVGLLVALLVMGGGILALVMTSFDHAAIYSKGVDEVVASREKLAARTLRVEGKLVKGSLVRRDQPCEYRFRIAKNGAELPVRYSQCVVPDTFRDRPDIDVMVTAEGRLASSEDGAYLNAHQIMAKCPSKYEMKERASKGEKAPHSPIGPTSAAETRALGGS